MIILVPPPKRPSALAFIICAIIILLAWFCGYGAQLAPPPSGRDDSSNHPIPRTIVEPAGPMPGPAKANSAQIVTPIVPGTNSGAVTANFLPTKIEGALAAFDVAKPQAKPAWSNFAAFPYPTNGGPLAVNFTTTNGALIFRARSQYRGYTPFAE